MWNVKCEVWSVKRAVRSVKCEVENRCTHGLGWSTAHASSIDEKGLIYIYISLRQLLLRLVWVIIYGNVGDMSRLTQKEHG